MKFLLPPDGFIFTALGLFVLAYGLYAFRIIRLAVALRTGFRHVIIKLALRGAYFSLLLIALLQPVFGEQLRESSVALRNVWLVIDVSNSMQADDLKPTRLEAALQAARGLVQQSVATRFGVIAYSDQALMLCPLSYDRDMVLQALSSVRMGLLPEGGSAPGQAWALLKRKLTPETPKGKVLATGVVWWSDDFGGLPPPAEVDAYLKEHDSKIYPVLVGTAAQVGVSVNGVPLTDEQGQPLLCPVDAAGFEKYFAEMENGKRFVQSNQVADVNPIIKEIATLSEDAVIKAGMGTVFDKYYYFVALALVLILVDVFVVINIIKI